MAKTQKYEGLCEKSQKVLNKLKKAKLEGAKIELLGTWIWVSGDTKQHKDKLNEIGLKYAATKKKWVFPDPEQKYDYKARKQSMKTIRAKYKGQVVVDNMQETQLALGM